MRRFFLGLWLTTAIAHLVFAGAVNAALARLGVPFAPLFAVASAALLAALFRGRVELLRDDRPISRARRALELAYLAHWCGSIAATALFVAGALVLAVVWLTSIGAGVPRPLPFGDLAIGSQAAGFLLALYGVAHRARRATIRSIDVPIPELAPDLDGYRIAQLSDLHIGSLTGDALPRRWIAAANRLDVDLVALTGDYVTNGVRFHETIARAAGELRARDGVIAVLGNHDYFGGGEPLSTLLGERGVVLLRNARHTVRRGAASLELAGLDDTWTRRADIERTMRGWDGARPLVVLAHDPSVFPDFARHGAALVLSGHTHWGQVGVPFAATRWNLARRVFRFSAGLYRDGASLLYVNPGLGTTGPPVRLGSAPEITVFTLRRTEPPPA